MLTPAEQHLKSAIVIGVDKIASTVIDQSVVYDPKNDLDFSDRVRFPKYAVDIKGAGNNVKVEFKEVTPGVLKAPVSHFFSYNALEAIIMILAARIDRTRTPGSPGLLTDDTPLTIQEVASNASGVITTRREITMRAETADGILTQAIIQMATGQSVNGVELIGAALEEIRDPGKSHIGDLIKATGTSLTRQAYITNLGSGRMPELQNP